MLLCWGGVVLWFAIVYSELAHENVNKFENFIFHRVKKNQYLFYTDMVEEHSTELSHNTHIYIN